MRPKDLKFAVDQFRKDNLANAMQACAIDILMILIGVFSNRFFTGALQMITDLAGLVIASAYMVYAAIDNFRRTMTIRKYEAELRSNSDR